MKLASTILACATLGIGSLFVEPAQAGDWSLDVQIVAGQPQRKVWVEPVYEIRAERVWVEPVYEDRCERVWVEPVVEKRTERVWVDEVVETRQRRYIDHWGREVITYERVVVVPGHWQDVCRDVVVREGHWQDVTRRVIVREGYWTMVSRQVCVRQGYWTWQPVPGYQGGYIHGSYGSYDRRESDVRVNRGRVETGSARRYDDDADRYRDERNRTRDNNSEYERSQGSRDRGDRYR